MEKLLTISVAAYNVGEYLRQTLSSCIVPSIDNLEIIVINDGSTDSTSRIAHEYSEQYPNSIFVVDKENGGYGTTINVSKELASGKYFKLLDGDDWVDSDGLEQLLQYLKLSNADLVLTRYSEVVEGSNPEDRIRGWCNYPLKSFQINDGVDLGDNFMVCMWEAAFKTDLVKRVVPELPAHSLYTDQIFISYLLSSLESVSCTDINVYQYRLSRDGQSASPESRVRHYAENVSVVRSCIESAPPASSPKPCRQLWSQRFGGYMRFLIKTLLYLPHASEAASILREIDCELRKKVGNDLYAQVMSTSEYLLILSKTRYRLCGLYKGLKLVEKKWA